ncbi:MAG: 1-(5-phosphoribosyl)-5-[(5-phosphoribosylamino)methylideneamino]imidazole-4-carboxamide isomerase [Oscillospiraceae bacterium]|nr:1-(5-phosphoribosyl)-5-[(5-phosphoribosylamino)methylideneamino]imidazole-4-carboxamide isomerase [Oscillospiraceae bacterium]
MVIYPAIDLYEGKAVRLYKGDYQQMTVYSENPVEVAKEFARKGATYIHLVDLEGAKNGDTPNFEVVRNIKAATSLFCEVGGGIRSMEVIRRYMDAGIDRVILGTAAVTDPDFLKEAVTQYGKRIAVGVDIRDGYVAIKGWTEKSQLEAFAFCEKMEQLGVPALICTDISKDGAMQGANHDLYQQLSSKFSMDIIASGGVSSLEDVQRLAKMKIHGAIIGKAYYTGAIDLSEAIEVAK